MGNVTTGLESCPANRCLHLVFIIFFFLIKILIDLFCKFIFCLLSQKIVVQL